jgi:uncharacterized membrane protein
VLDVPQPVTTSWTTTITGKLLDPNHNGIVGVVQYLDADKTQREVATDSNGGFSIVITGGSWVPGVSVGSTELRGSVLGQYAPGGFLPVSWTTDTNVAAAQDIQLVAPRLYTVTPLTGGTVRGAGKGNRPVGVHGTAPNAGAYWPTGSTSPAAVGQGFPGPLTTVRSMNALQEFVGESDTIAPIQGLMMDPTPHAFYASQGQMHDLGTLGGRTSQARDINLLHEVVGVAEDHTLVTRGFYWNPTLNALQMLQFNGEDVLPVAIGNNGTILGNWTQAVPTPAKWAPILGPTVLFNRLVLVPAQGAPTAIDQPNYFGDLQASALSIDGSKAVGSLTYAYDPPPPPPNMLPLGPLFAPQAAHRDPVSGQWFVYPVGQFWTQGVNPLVVLPTGASEALAVNSQGDAVGYRGTSAALWQNSQPNFFTDVNTLVANGSYARAFDISEDGVILVAGNDGSNAALLTPPSP